MNPRSVSVAVRFTVAEAADLDARRGRLDRSTWLRALHIAAVRDGVSYVADVSELSAEEVAELLQDDE